ncbi:UDP-N-acetylmuramoyl-L-alanyl-D-glutamate--2,6-diaminopimelate ligase [Ammoniphilus oxalaticus]|uniref:UDP-N-acetylmuramoyl-L-alanyl-D-glutamate--2,6-diaminopimelate ligase n=1 Tax=Ammoniphilus oxalaticus TaxID=66863 RepID=A0A419SJH5_9BACL|nr:UDP-N-acetylmuramoyl-L-alanyl-D-glutamate--2,6-diaminopimelate ligase [Ammoniphilus oxalaticus]RKD24096.1 UDP-N-acetylmuramoyl-L-alanyl-D-glutamate--2,6-diaminopimelate ligase [Ammoniphilus oxalaticus]
MKLRELLSSLINYQTEADLDLEITGIETDSRKVKPGYLFVALRGFTVDGHDYIQQARMNGAVAFVTERKIEGQASFIIVPDTKKALAVLADAIYLRPTSRLNLIGITGTNGKTTITHLVEKIMNDAGKLTGIIGTIEMRVGQYREEVKNTTPESLQLQRLFSLMLEHEASHACIEVSSHALQMGRVWGCDFKTAIFTNLSQDHLDYHETMENYLQAKALLFAQLGSGYQRDNRKIAILNKDDQKYDALYKVTAAEVITYGIENEADVRATNIEIGATGTRFTLNTFKGAVSISMKLVGMFSVYNVLAATAACLVEGVSLSSIKVSIEAISGVPGRFEPVLEGQAFAAIVDYAHTPDSLENVLKTVREITAGKVYCIVGCGGDRDRGKRPLMAQIAATYADTAIYTSDNPRSEDPKRILEDMVQGLTDETYQSATYHCILDRKEAIEFAVSKAKSGDAVLIAGKGHETYQIIKDQVLPFDDKQVVAVAIRKRME